MITEFMRKLQETMSYVKPKRFGKDIDKHFREIQEGIKQSQSIREMRQHPGWIEARERFLSQILRCDRMLVTLAIDEKADKERQVLWAVRESMVRLIAVIDGIDADLETQIAEIEATIQSMQEITANESGLNLR